MSGSLITATLLLFSLPHPAAAIFGVGDVVFDPTSYATLGSIMRSDASSLVKAAETITQLKKLYANGMQTYNLAMTMANHATHMTRMGWVTVGVNAAAVGLADKTHNKYGEVAAYANLMNGRTGIADGVWAASTIFVKSQSTDVMRHDTVGQSRRLASLASVEMADGSATKCLETIAAYRYQAGANARNIARLQAAVQDDSDPTNTQVAQMNLANALSVASVMEQESQGAIHACEVEQNVIANKNMRDNTVEAMNTQGDFTATRSGTHADLGGIANTHYHYVPAGF